MSSQRGGGGRGGGRGAYYRERYGRGGASRRRTDDAADDDAPRFSASLLLPPAPAVVSSSLSSSLLSSSSSSLPSSAAARSDRDLQQLLLHLDGKSYKAYNDILGQYRFAQFVLVVDHIQSDPFAAPSRCHVLVPAAVTRYPREWTSSRIRRVALCDYLTRSFARTVAAGGLDQRHEPAGNWHAAKGGDLRIDTPGQHVLERTSAQLQGDGTLDLRFTVALPAQGRSILGREAARLLTEMLPYALTQSIPVGVLDAHSVVEHLVCVEDQDDLRAQIVQAGLVAFVGNGSRLPRQSGVDDRPLAGQHVVPFTAPPSLSASFTLKSGRQIAGLAIKRGITLIVGGGYHGKSTLLQALEMGVYNKIPNDGRELVVCDANAAKVTVEDGRAVCGVDISPFINGLPLGKDTRAFTTQDASGSTSQAAGVIEALEVGATTLLIDEDTCAANFMIRDRRMQRLVAKRCEPICPLVFKIRALLQDHGVSSVLVVGGSGDYLDVADTVVLMENYQPRDVTDEARAIAREYPSNLIAEGGDRFGTLSSRIIVPASLNPYRFDDSHKTKVQAKDNAILFGREEIDLTHVQQIAERSQTRAIADALQWIKRAATDKKTLAQLLTELDAVIDARGLDCLTDWVVGSYARPRRHEIAGAINRLRTLQVLTSHGIVAQQPQPQQQRQQPQARMSLEASSSAARDTWEDDD